MADPICRWRNPYVKTVREFISELPKTEMESIDFRNKMDNSIYGADFFRTPYQLACQLGLYYEQEGKYYPRFHHDANISEVNLYLESWLEKYPVPNPYTKQGFENIPPISIHSKMCEMLLMQKNPIDWDVAKLDIFGERIGNDDILTNTIYAYSEVLQIKNNKLILKDGVIYEDLTEYILPNKFIERNDKKAFFNLFGDNLNVKIKSDDSLDEIIHDQLIEENESIRDFAFNVFSHFYGENWSELISQTTSKPAIINSTDYISHDLDLFPRLIGEFTVSQTKESLTSSNTQRFFEEPIYHNKDKYFFFSNQWNGTGDDLSFNSLKTYFEKNNPDYKFEKIDKVYKLFKLGDLGRIKFDYKAFHEKTKEVGLKFSEKIVSRFIASLCTKPFVICSGLSGSGKTKLAQSFVKWICRTEEQYKIVPVGADWTNREPLLGFPNGLDPDKYVFPDSGVLQLIMNASKLENKDKPFFLILDEMNLSHVERYFADFLSIMESRDNIKLYSGQIRNELANEVSWPENLFIIGTVNIDETTYMFSPKVLDRANVIEFRISESELREYIAKPGGLDMTRFINQTNKQGYGAGMATNFMERTRENANSTISTQDTLVLFFNELRKCGAEFGYRSASEINRLIAVLYTLTNENKKWDEKDVTANDFIDIAIMQKLLPKLHGSRNKLSKVLPVIGGLCLQDKEKIKENYLDKIDTINYFEDSNIKYKLSFEKICRMYKNAIENGYASYAEA